MMGAIDFKKDYIDWLNGNIYQNQVSDDVYRMDFPYLDRNNDFLEIYIQVISEDEYILSDDGETLSELEMSGMNVFSSNRRADIFNEMLRGHGVELGSHNDLTTRSNRADLPQKKHMLMQCMLQVSDMFYLSRHQVKSLFIEDVKGFLSDNRIYGIPDVSFAGKSGLVTNYDFAIPRRAEAPERLVKIVNRLDVQKAGYITFLWEDTTLQRPYESKLYVFIQDSGITVSQPALNAMRQYDIKPVLWSEREGYIEELAA